MKWQSPNFLSTYIKH